MKKFENLGKTLSKQEQKKISRGVVGGGGGGLSCEDECIILEGHPSGCDTGETCVDVTCEQAPNTCVNICLKL